MIFKKIILLLTLTLTCTYINAQETNPLPLKTRTATFTTTVAYITIDGMACQEGCADTISENLEKIAGVQSAEVSYADGKAIIKFDDNQIKIEEIEKVITDTKVKDYVYTITNSVLKNKIVR